MKRVCVFCGSSSGRRPEYAQAAEALADALADTGRALVYGGGNTGLMGALADRMLARGAGVIGIIPQGMLHREVGHPGLRDLRVVATMHERKALMAELAEGFVALPGGFGTLDEFCEILTWAQIGLHAKPCGLLDAAGYFGRFLAFLDHAVAEGFIKPRHRARLVVAADPAELLRTMDRS